MAMRKALAVPAAVLAIGLPFAAKWEGVVYVAHWDKFGRVYDICYGSTRMDGRPVRPGDTATHAQCAEMLELAYAEHYRDLVTAFPTVAQAPASVQAMAADLVYNNGIANVRAGKSTSHYLRTAQWERFCKILPQWKKSLGQVVQGLINRRNNSRDICLSGLKGA